MEGFKPALLFIGLLQSDAVMPKLQICMAITVKLATAKQNIIGGGKRISYLVKSELSMTTKV